MWTLSNSQLPAVAQPETVGAPLFYTDLGTSLAPLCRVDFQANYVLPGIQTTVEPAIVSATTPANSGLTTTISVGNLVQVDAVSIGNQTYTFTPMGNREATAPDPANPQPGQFTFNGSSVTLHASTPIPANIPVAIVGGIETTPTDYIDPSILDVFHGLPVVARLQWSMSLENHPSGSITLRAIGDAAERIVAHRFKKGSELTFAGIGFSVSSYTKKLTNTDDAPDRVWDISVSLGGKWERRKYNRPSFLLGNTITGAAQPLPYQDPDCALSANNPQRNRSRTKPDQVSVAALAAQVGGRFVGFSSGGALFAARVSGVKANRSPLGAWNVRVSPDTTDRDTASWIEAADACKRKNGTYLDYCTPDAVTARSTESGTRWNYAVKSIDITYKGDCDHAPGVEGFAVQYQAVRLTGEFSEPVDPNLDEDNQGTKEPPRVKWKARDIKIRKFQSGDVNPTAPPETFPIVRNMNLTFDTSGPTKEFIEVTTHDGVEMLKTRRVYGAMFNSDQVMKDDNEGDPIPGTGRRRGPILHPTTELWRQVQEETTETQIDEKTRYILGSKTTGWRMGRYMQESDQLEILDFIGSRQDGESAEDFRDRKYREKLYRFEQFPTYAVEQKRLEQFGTHYKDAAKEPIPVDYEKKCLPDGSSKLVPIRNPNYVEPMFESAHLTYSNSFSWTLHPDSVPEDPVPPLTQGEERQTYKTRQILPSTNTNLTLDIDTFDLQKNDFDSFIENNWESSTQGAGFGEYTSRRTFSVNEGRPGAAQRMPDRFEKEQPEQKQGDPNIHKQIEAYEYILCTPGHGPSEPSTGSISFASASTLSDGLIGAKTDLKIRDVLESVGYSAAIGTNFQIRPMDYITLNDGANGYACRVVQIENEILIQGQVDDFPLVVAPQGTRITAGIDRTIPVSLTVRKLPQKPEPPKPPNQNELRDPRRFGLTLGEILPRDMQGRGNY